MKWLYIISFLIMFPFKHYGQVQNNNDRVKLNVKPITNHHLIIEGNIQTLPFSSTITIRIWENIISVINPEATPYVEYKCSSRNGRFSFNISTVYRPVYFSLYYSNGKNFDQILKNISLYVAEPGDSVNLTLVQGSLHFQGRGASKYKCRYELDSLKSAIIKSENSFTSYGRKHVRSVVEQMIYNDTSFAVNWLNRTKSQFAKNDLILNKELDLLKNYQSQLSAFSYQVMHLDIISEGLIKKLYAIKSANGRLRKLNSLARTSSEHGRVSFQKEGIKRLYHKTFSILNTDTMPHKIQNLSKNYIELIFMKTLQDGEYSNDSETQDYYTIRRKFSGDLRDKLLARYFLDKFNNLKDGGILVEDALSIVKNNDCKLLINKVGNQRAGSKAFNFLLPDENGKVISLKQFAGKVVVLDFWFTGCAGCSEFYKDVLSSVEEKFKDNNRVIFISISAEYNRDKWLKSVRQNLYTSDNEPNVINLYTNGEGFQHEVIKYYNIAAYPHPFIIDRNGIIFNSNEGELRDVKTLTQLILGALKDK